jgi:hypothetical protein
MMKTLARLFAWMAPILLLSLCPAFLHGASQIGESNADKASAGSKETVTGCLQKGDEPGGITIIDKYGKVWELQSNAVQLADHVGHTVTVDGTVASKSKTQEQEIETSEKKEVAGREHGDLQVSDLKMVSDSCK